jgi:hypothetical protein
MKHEDAQVPPADAGRLETPPNARVQAGTTAPQPDPERDEAARRGASPGTKC